MTLPHDPRACQALENEVKILLRITQDLIDEKLFSSAAIVGELLLCRSNTLTVLNPATAYPHWCALSLYADALEGKGEPKRASACYSQALTQRRLRASQTPRSAGRDPLQLIRKKKVSTSSWQDDYKEEAQLKFKEARCLMKGGVTGDAIASLESIISFARTPEMNVHLAKTYEVAGLKKQAATSYKNALKANCFALETILPLLALGETEASIWSLIEESAIAQKANEAAETNQQQHEPTSEDDFSISLSDTPWLRIWLAAQAAAVGGDAKLALGWWRKLSKEYPTCLVSRIGEGRALLELDRLEEADCVLRSAHEQVPLNVDGMDDWGIVLHRRCTAGGPEDSLAASALNALTKSLLSIDLKRPEPWLAAALYCHVKGDAPEHAVAFADRALALDARYVPALVFKGERLQQEGRVDLAHGIYVQVNNIKQSMHTFERLVETCLALHKYAEASSIAKQARQLMPNRAGPLVLTGEVLIQTAKKQNARKGADGIASNPAPPPKAIQAFREALALEHMHIGATMALADAFAASGQKKECIEFLLHAYDKYKSGVFSQMETDVLPFRLAEAYVAVAEYSEAMTYYHIAAGINPNNEAIGVGLRKMDRLLRNLDPDADTDDDEPVEEPSTKHSANDINGESDHDIDDEDDGFDSGEDFHGDESDD